MGLKLSFFYSKRGVSPLIATVLLISFAVALGSVVLNWGRNLDISKPNDLCAGVSIKIRNIDGAEACYSGSGTNTYLQFILDNNGDADIDGLGIWVAGKKATKLMDFNNLPLRKGELLEISDTSVKFDTIENGEIKNIQFFPKVKNVDSIEICARNLVKATNIKRC